MGEAFDNWIDELDEDVIQGEYGFERGEFGIFPELWRPLFDEGLTPAQAYRRALDGWDAARREEDERRRLNWERIQREDRAALLPPTDEVKS